MAKKEISKEQGEVYSIENMLEEAIFPPVGADTIPNKKELDTKMYELFPKLQKDINCTLSRSELAILYGLPLLLSSLEVEEQILETISQRNQAMDISKLSSPVQQTKQKIDEIIKNTTSRPEDSPFECFGCSS